MMGVTFSHEKSTVSTVLEFASSFTVFIFSKLSFYHILATKGRYFILVRQQFPRRRTKNNHDISEVDDIDNSEVVSFKIIPKLTVFLNSKNLHIELPQKVLLIVKLRIIPITNLPDGYHIFVSPQSTFKSQK
jgi:hypothetical protein